MAAEVKKEIQLEIAHVLFTDIVGYSKLPTNQQRALIERLNEIVRGTDEYQAANAAGRLIIIPTGDGITLVFYHSPEAPVECALEISRALKKHPELQLRMGIHSGPVSGVIDATGKANVAGAGVNIAQRVMDCGDAGHILLSKHVAEDLEEYPHWEPHLHQLAECEVKHGVRVSVVNLYTEELGNPALPEKLKAARVAAARRKRAAIRRLSLGVTSLLTVIAVIGFFLFRYRRPIELPVPEKSIAVLPFESRSEDKANAYFTDGVQDEILTDLAKIADLKVISRTSVLQYKSGVARNLRQIAHQLGVANVVEGSVQRSGNRVRVNAQLVDARTDAHLWAQTYDRDLADVFAIQSEIAEQIVSQLKSKMSPREKAAIDVRPTRDLEAFDLYFQAKQLINTFHDTPDWKETLLKAIRLLDEAISLDGNFALAYCLATRANEALYWFNLDHTPVRLAQAKAFAQKALALAPDSGEAHLAQALVCYHGDRDYTRAREELAIARRALPNNAEVYSVAGWIDRRQGRWEDAVKNLEKAAELDPRNSHVLNDLAVLYDVLRRYDDEESVFDRAIAANPSSTTYFQLMRAEIELEKGNTKTTRTGLDSLPAGYDPNGATTSTQINLALYERDPASAAKILAASKLEELVGNTGSLLPRSWFEALIARAQGNVQKARDAFVEARWKIEAKLQQQPDDGLLLAMAGLIDAGLSRKTEAVAEGRRAVELRPISDDALDGAVVVGNLAMIYAWVGDVDSAIEQLMFLAKKPGGPDYGQLKLDPAWDPLRGDPRFEQIVASFTPKETAPNNR
jgi:TolB-like protein/class 3 adenylate cyclase/Tfp pilus assembly protein PilF